MVINNSEISIRDFMDDKYMQILIYNELERYQNKFKELGITLEELPGIIRQSNMRKKLLESAKK